MYFLSPNVTQICNANTAAKLLGNAGGLTALSQMPACNILLLGAQKKNNQAGFSAAATMPHTGFIFYCDVVQAQPPEFRRKCARLVAGKVALAARVDSYQTSKGQGATVGISMKADILGKMVKAQAPPPAKLEKALPKPDAVFKKKRGGKRFRAQKDKTSMSDARKAAGRMGFATVQEDMYQNEMGHTLGSLSKDGEGSGAFRVQIDSKKSKGGTISKKMAKRLAKQQNTRAGNLTALGGGRGMSGTSSVAFTPVQGLEINMNTSKKRKVDDANAKYFGNNTFAAAKRA
jgi:U4/U6 small nuclear ribonucleoprotein PRP31